MAHDVASRDRAVDVGDDYLGAVVPEEDLARHFLLTLQAAADRKCHEIHSRLEAERGKLL